MFTSDAHASIEAALNADEPAEERTAQRWWLIAAAVLLAVLLGTVLLKTTTRTPSTTPPIAKVPSHPQTAAVLKTAAIDPIVAAALREGRIAPPRELASIRGTTGTLRGKSSGVSGTLAPAGVFITDQQPLLMWHTASAGPYIVSVFVADQEIARSPKLEKRAWTPPPLQRGKTYEWQVALPNQEVLPAPPSPPAAFHVIDASSWESIETARRNAPDDHLLLGVVYARAGLQADAKRELSTFVEQHPDDQGAKKLLGSVEAW